MKRRSALALLLAGALFSGIAASAADAGSAVDPLIALNWIKNTFVPNMVSQAGARIDQQTQAVYDHTVSAVSVGDELRVKRKDVLHLSTGSTLTPLAGSLSAAASGAIVDVTDGIELSLGGDSAVMLRHRYLTAEETQAAFSVTSDTAVIRVTGSYTLNPSTEPDYNALADALRDMGLFRGGDIPYGSGYDLESAPTRIQGLILFLRFLGEEDIALAYSGSGVAFADVPDWAIPYAAYAYSRGYTNGQGTDPQGRVVFGSQELLAPRDYVTFLLRALGYADGSDFQWLTAVADARELGVLTEGESALLVEKTFLRAQVVYLSYYALSAQTAGKNGDTLLNRLTGIGAVDAGAARSAMAAVTDNRL